MSHKLISIISKTNTKCIFAANCGNAYKISKQSWFIQRYSEWLRGPIFWATMKIRKKFEINKAMMVYILSNIWNWVWVETKLFVLITCSSSSIKYGLDLGLTITCFSLSVFYSVYYSFYVFLLDNYQTCQTSIKIE